MFKMQIATILTCNYVKHTCSYNSGYVYVSYNVHTVLQPVCVHHAMLTCTGGRSTAYARDQKKASEGN